MKPFLTASLVLARCWVRRQCRAKLPPPSDEAKAKAAEAAAKTAHNDKVDAYQLCKSMDKVAADYFAAAKKAGTETKPPVRHAAVRRPRAPSSTHRQRRQPLVAARLAAAAAPALAPAPTK